MSQKRKSRAERAPARNSKARVDEEDPTGTAPAAADERSVAVIWLRKSLRLDDNAALVAAANGSEFRHVVVAFALDPHFVPPTTVCASRYRFLQESLLDVDRGLQQRYGPEQRLVVARGPPTEALGALFDLCGPCTLLFEADVEPYAVQRDAAVCRLARDRGVPVRRFHGHTLYPLPQLVGAVAAGSGKPPTTMKGIQALFSRVGDVPLPVDAPATLQPLPAALLARVRSGELSAPPPAPDGERGVVPGGETEGQQRLRAKVVEGVEYVCGFEKPRTAAVSPDGPDDDVSTTLLSPYLKFGCVSVRRVHAEVRAAQARGRQRGLKVAGTPGSLLGQLYFREMAYLLASYPGGFEAQVRDVAWTEPGSREEVERLAAWEEGRTGFPFIDACMRQLRATGWLHHLQRHAVACFLTRGDLWVDWRRGQAVFDRLLLDSDWALNYHNWLALAGVAPWSPPYFRIYSPEIDPRKASSLNVRDPAAVWLKRWLPELAALSPRHAYQPWTCPQGDLAAAGVVLGETYPRRIVDHKAAAAENVGRFKASRSA